MKLIKSQKIALENGQECLECDCYLYCTMDTCILDIDDEIQEFEFTDREGIESVE